MTKEEKLYKSVLADMGCMVCRNLYGITDGPVELHHLRTGGWGKGDYTTLIPLCFEHHRGNAGIHTKGTKAWVLAIGLTQETLLEQTQLLAAGQMNRMHK